MLDYTPTGEAESRYIQRLPGQFENSLRRAIHYLHAHQNYSMPIEREAQKLIEQLYGEAGLAAAEREWQMMK